VRRNATRKRTGGRIIHAAQPGAASGALVFSESMPAAVEFIVE
jgi:hypothetical protein